MNAQQFDHLFLLGHIGAGKTFHARILRDKLNMFVFNLDMFRQISTVDELKKKIKEAEAYLKAAPNEIAEKSRRESLRFRLVELKMRQLAPHAKNFEEMGYSEEFAKSLFNRFGKLNATKLSILYQQFFFDRMLNDILKDLKQPCIIDTSGGQFINYDYRRELSIITQSYCKWRNIECIPENIPEEILYIYELYKFGEGQYDKSKSRTALKAIGNIVYFKQDKNLFNEINKAAEWKANVMLTRDEYVKDIESFDPLIIDTTDVFDMDKGNNDEKINKNINEIVHYYNENKKSQR